MLKYVFKISFSDWRSDLEITRILLVKHVFFSERTTVT